MNVDILLPEPSMSLRFMEALESRQLCAASVGLAQVVDAISAAAIVTAAATRKPSPVGQYKGPMKMSGPGGRYIPAERPVLAVRSIGSNRYEARVYGAFSMDITGGYMVFRGSTKSTSLTLVGTQLSHELFPGVETPAGIKQTIKISANSNWTKLKVSFTTDTGLYGGYQKQTWTGTLARL